jgi:2,4-dichlorophenol 6-monooxygenase
VVDSCAALPRAAEGLELSTGESLSTLDLVDRCCGGHPLLLLLLGRAPDAEPWLAAARALESLPLRVCQIVPATPGRQGVSDPEDPAGGVPIKDAFGHWQRVREVSEAGAILVRPDGHVAWRSHDASSVEHSIEQLRTAVQRTMSLCGSF